MLVDQAAPATSPTPTKVDAWSHRVVPRPSATSAADRQGVAESGQPEGARNSEPRRDAPEVCGLVEVHILAGIYDVEPTDPEQNRQPEQHWRPGQAAPERDPGRHSGPAPAPGRASSAPTG